VGDSTSVDNEELLLTVVYKSVGQAWRHMHICFINTLFCNEVSDSSG